ncbi:MAG TPA: DUF4412 domain-containing protein [Candidatus Binatia bacterium]|nr:DUF4412 domain-containing protein [Candidatus Binatia bacterium]
MKKTLILLSAGLFIAARIPAQAQFNHPGNSPADNIFAKVFGTSLNFSATMETDIKLPDAEKDMTMSGKIYFANGNSRTEMDMAKIQGGKMSPHAADQMKAMGMDQMISIYRNDTKTIYMIYPGLESYAKLETPEAKQGTNDSTVAKAELGKETVDGHPCVKTRYTVANANKDGDTILIAWQATDLKNYPVKIEMNPPGESKDQHNPTTTLHFTDINTTQPEASLFEPPTGYHVYTDIRAMMQTEVMKKMNGGMGMPPNHPGMPAGHPPVAPEHP